MIWPFSRWMGKNRDRQQICESLSRIAERDIQQRHAARAENCAAANGVMMAVEHRMIRTSPLREVLTDVVERQREQDRSR